MQVGIVYSLRNMYIIESQSDHQASAASVIEKKPPQTEALILFGEEKHSQERKLTDSCTPDRCSEVLLPFAKIGILKNKKATRVVQQKWHRYEERLCPQRLHTVTWQVTRRSRHTHTLTVIYRDQNMRRCLYSTFCSRLAETTASFLHVCGQKCLRWQKRGADVSNSQKKGKTLYLLQCIPYRN